MNRPTRWSVAFGAGILLSVTALAPIAAAVPAAGAAPASSSTVSPGGDFRAGLSKSLPRQIFERAINGDDYECGPTAFDAYIGEVLGEFTDAQWDFLEEHPDAFDVPTYDALIFGTSTDPFYGYTSHGAQVKNSFRDVKKFWDIDSSDIQLLAMHGSSNLDAARISRTLSFLYEVPESEVATYSQEIADFFNAAGPAFYDNPIFTLNAFAFSGEGQPDPAVAAIPDKLVFGDGFLDAMDALGLGDVGPRVVMGHEFGHHIQYEQHLFDTNPPLPGPEATRRTELMADAMAGYFGVHKRGLALNAKRTVDAIMAFYLVGDCQFTNPGHHGTPNQREAAATWGTEMATAAQPKSFVLGSLAFADLFDQKLPEFIAPDA